MSDSSEFTKKLMAALDKASETHEFIGIQEGQQMANYKPKSGKRRKVKSFHYRVFTKDGTGESPGHVEVFIGKYTLIIEL